jgi:hypothetical protein
MLTVAVVAVVAGLACALYAGFEVWVARRSWQRDREILRILHGDLDGD